MPSTMLLPSQSLFTSPNPRFTSYFTKSTAPKIPNFPMPLSPRPSANPLNVESTCKKFQTPEHFEPFRARRSLLRAFESEDNTVQADELRIGNRHLETFLSFVESLCLTSYAVLSIGLVVNWAMSRWQKGFLGLLLVDGVLAGQGILLVSAVAIGAWIRRRQWRRISSSSLKRGLFSEVNLVERVEKLEEEFRSSAAIARVLSRQLEKLGIRFRITSKALKEPIAETAALAQNNSEATHAVALREDILEKELGEIQKVLMAMQEQQQKQLELILAICKNARLLENRQSPNQEQETIKTYTSASSAKAIKPHQTQPVARHQSQQ